jgi:hypothetical protein
MMPLFRIPFGKRNIPVVLCGVLLTETVIVFTGGRELINNEPHGYLIAVFIAGFVITLVKALVYEQLLVTKKPKHGLAYGLFGGLISWGAHMAAVFPLHGILQN